jgi:hypothetical protein
LLTALATLPDSAEFVSIHAFSDAIFQRVGEHFAFGYRQSRPNVYGWEKKTPQQLEQEVALWRKHIQSEWRKRELTGWMSFSKSCAGRDCRRNRSRCDVLSLTSYRYM